MTAPTLNQYIHNHTARTACQCGRCVVSGGDSEAKGTTSAKLTFFDVFLKCGPGEERPSAEVLRVLIREHRGEFCEVNPLDGAEHNFMELGGWLGDQETALRFIGLCDLLGLGKCLSPDTLLPFVDDATKKMMAGSGMVALKANP